jgi:DNA-binding NarL/FixJ family response regulator
MNEPASILGGRSLRILLVDDQPMVRQGLRILFGLEPGAAVVGEAGSAAQGLALAASLKPDLVIMDVEMPHMDGITATGLLMATLPDCLVIILSIHGDAATRSRAMAAGAWAFVEKGQPDDLQVAFRRARDHYE